MVAAEYSAIVDTAWPGVNAEDLTENGVKPTPADRSAVTPKKNPSHKYPPLLFSPENISLIILNTPDFF